MNNNSIFKAVTVIVSVFAIIAMIYFYKDFGFGVIVIPIVLGIMLYCSYLKQRVLNKLDNHFFENINKQYSTELNLNERRSSKYSAISYILFGSSIISLLLTSLTKGYSIYLAIVLYVLGLFSTIISVIKDPNSKTNKTLLFIYLVLTITILAFLSTITNWINSWINVTS
jgi:hypothetical protein